jgi:hypothetical protein
MIFEFFKKKEKIGIPTIKANADHKKDDKEQHKLFLIEFNDLLESTNIFKPEYIKKYVGLYKKYEPFTGRSNKVHQQSYFEESLLDPALKKEAKKLVELMIFIAEQRAYNQVDLNRKKTLASKVVLKFPKNSVCCSELLKYKKKFDNKSVLITKAPIFPLKSCINCGCAHPNLTIVSYQIDLYS